MLRTKAVILAKLETSYGVDPTPTKGANAILCELPDFEVIGKKLERSYVKGYYGPLPPVTVGEGLKISFTTELKGGGRPGADVIEPEISPLFQACNFDMVGDGVDGTPIIYFTNSNDTTANFAPNRVSNGTFTTDLTGWSGASWAWHSNTKARHTAGATTPLIQAGTAGIVGQTEKLGFTIANRTAGSVKIGIGGQESASFTATPTSDIFLTSTTAGTLRIIPTTDFDGDIDTVTCEALSGGSVTSKSVAIYYYQHNILHKMLGCKGSFSIDNKTNEYSKIKWEFTGIYDGAVDSLLPVSPTWNATLPPIFRSAAFRNDQYSAIVEMCKIDVKNEIAKRVSANAVTGIMEYYIKGRNVTGEFDPEAVALATRNFWSIWENSTPFEVELSIGTEPGNTINIVGAHAYSDVPKYADREGLLTYSIPVTFCPTSAGNDEITFAFL